MKILFHALLYVLVILTSQVFSAPVGNSGSPVLWEDGFLEKDGSFNFIVSYDFDVQENFLPDQINRFAWTDPRQATPEVRHYFQIRSSENRMMSNGITVGTTINDSSMIYLMTGAFSSRISLVYSDKTIVPLDIENDQYFHINPKFRSDNDFYYGAGFKAIMHEDTYKMDIPVKVGIDFKYKKFEMEDNSLASSKQFYSASFDEIQMAFTVSAEYKTCYPYLGLRISSITGKEHFIDNNHKSVYYDSGFIDYQRDITWNKNLGAVAGVSFYLKELYLINLEVRQGDEDGVGLTATVKF